MTRINTRQSQRSGKAFELLESDVYRMEIKRATVEPDTFAEPDDNNVYPDKLVLCWEVYEATDDQDEGIVGLSVWQRMAPYYGVGKRGPSQFKVLVDSLIEQGLLPETTDPDDFETDDLVGIKQRVTIEKYTKTMGINKGEFGNKVIGKPLPISRKKAATTAKKNVPVAVADDDDMPF